MDKNIDDKPYFKMLKNKKRKQNLSRPNLKEGKYCKGELNEIFKNELFSFSWSFKDLILRDKTFA